MGADPTEGYLDAVNHPVRRGLLRLVCNGDEPISPAYASRELHVELPNVAYHMHKLEDNGLVECVDERPNRGSMEHFYSPVPAALEHPVVKAVLGLE